MALVRGSRRVFADLRVAVGGPVGGFLLTRFGFHATATNNQFTSNVIGVVGGFVAGLGVYAIFGFFKTRRYMQPIIVTVGDGVQSSGGAAPRI